MMAFPDQTRSQLPPSLSASPERGRKVSLFTEPDPDVTWRRKTDRQPDGGRLHQV